jgi:HAD domain in Swiss Army Knife RNA repair proteins
MRAKDRIDAIKEPFPPGISARADAATPMTRERPAGASRPLLMVDIDGVISLFADGWGQDGTPRGSFHSIDGIPHFLSAAAAAHLLDLGAHFELIWASGWEEKANEHLPHLLGLPPNLPFLRFERAVGRANAHWKLDAIDHYAAGRALAWVDDALNEECHEWAAARSAPTLLVQTDPSRGLTDEEARRLADWARALPLS